MVQRIAREWLHTLRETFLTFNETVNQLAAKVVSTVCGYATGTA